jgi:hypothetical protein
MNKYIFNLFWIKFELNLIKAKNSIKEASSTCQQEDKIDQLEQHANKISNSIYQECDSLKDSFKKINQFLSEAKHFQV